MNRFTSCVLISVLAAGCGAHALNVGSDDGGVVPSGTGGATAVVATGGSGTTLCVSNAGPTLPTWSAPDACVIGNESPALVGTWEGYFQGTSIGDEASTFRLNILGANPTKGLCGTITFGTHTTPVTLPPATDPAAEYPPADMYQVPEGSLGGLRPMLGLPYTILDGKYDGQRVTFAYTATETIKSWCEIQTSYPNGSSCSQFHCRDVIPGVTGAGTCYLGQPTACIVPPACFYDACLCNASRCTANRDYVNAKFDLVFNGDEVTGVDDYHGQNVLMHRVYSADN